MSPQAYDADSPNRPGVIGRFVRSIRDYPYKKYRHLNRKYYRRRFRRDPTATFKVRGARFRFHDPQWEYLWRHFIGSGDEKPCTYEPSVESLLKTLLTGRGPCGFLDIGAYYGYFTAYVAALHGACEVHAFEPSPEFLPVLRRNVELNGNRARVHEVALSDEVGQIEFADRSMKKAEPGMTVHTVEAIPLDDLRQRESMRADIVKIDVHGCEAKVLRGMPRTLAEDVQHLLLEIHPEPWLVDATLKQVVDLVLDAGFELLELVDFRTAPQPIMVPVEGEHYAALVDMSRWTKEQERDSRMLYGRKRNS